MELCTCEKAALFLPVNILTVWCAGYLATRHTTVCLDTVTYILRKIQVARDNKYFSTL